MPQRCCIFEKRKKKGLIWGKLSAWNKAENFISMDSGAKGDWIRQNMVFCRSGIQFMDMHVLYHGASPLSYCCRFSHHGVILVTRSGGAIISAMAGQDIYPLPTFLSLVRAENKQISAIQFQTLSPSMYAQERKHRLVLPLERRF